MSGVCESSQHSRSLRDYTSLFDIFYALHLVPERIFAPFTDDEDDVTGLDHLHALSHQGGGPAQVAP